jgi:hypothetical protein
VKVVEELKLQHFLVVKILEKLLILSTFKKKLYRSLNVPPSRMDGEGGFNLGRSSEILRDEVKV